MPLLKSRLEKCRNSSEFKYEGTLDLSGYEFTKDECNPPPKERDASILDKKEEEEDPYILKWVKDNRPINLKLNGCDMAVKEPINLELNGCDVGIVDKASQNKFFVDLLVEIFSLTRLDFVIAARKAVKARYDKEAKKAEEARGAEGAKEDKKVTEAKKAKDFQTAEDSVKWRSWYSVELQGISPAVNPPAVKDKPVEVEGVLAEAEDKPAKAKNKPAEVSGLQKLLEALTKQPHLRRLDLSNNTFDENEFKALLELLKHCVELKYLSLEKCDFVSGKSNITSEQLTKLFMACRNSTNLPILPILPNLRELNVSSKEGEKLSPKAAAELERFVKTNKNLCEVTFDYEDSELKKQIESQLVENSRQAEAERQYLLDKQTLAIQAHKAAAQGNNAWLKLLLGYGKVAYETKKKELLSSRLRVAKDRFIRSFSYAFVHSLINIITDYVPTFKDGSDELPLMNHINANATKELEERLKPFFAMRDLANNANTKVDSRSGVDDDNDVIVTQERQTEAESCLQKLIDTPEVKLIHKNLGAELLSHNPKTTELKDFVNRVAADLAIKFYFDVHEAKVIVHKNQDLELEAKSCLEIETLQRNLPVKLAASLAQLEEDERAHQQNTLAVFAAGDIPAKYFKHFEEIKSQLLVARVEPNYKIPKGISSLLLPNEASSLFEEVLRLENREGFDILRVRGVDLHQEPERSVFIALLKTPQHPLFDKVKDYFIKWAIHDVFPHDELMRFQKELQKLKTVKDHLEDYCDKVLLVNAGRSTLSRLLSGQWQFHNRVEQWCEYHRIIQKFSTTRDLTACMTTLKNYSSSYKQESPASRRSRLNDPVAAAVKSEEPLNHSFDEVYIEDVKITDAWQNGLLSPADFLNVFKVLKPNGAVIPREPTYTINLRCRETTQAAPKFSNDVTVPRVALRKDLKLEDILNLRLSMGFVIGKGVIGADSFFDALAQALNKRGDSTAGPHTVKTLRKHCQVYCQRYLKLNDPEKPKVVWVKEPVDAVWVHEAIGRRQSFAGSVYKDFAEYTNVIVNTEEEQRANRNPNYKVVMGTPKVEGRMLCAMLSKEKENKNKELGDFSIHIIQITLPEDASKPELQEYIVDQWGMTQIQTLSRQDYLDQKNVLHIIIDETSKVGENNLCVPMLAYEKVLSVEVKQVVPKLDLSNALIHSGNSSARSEGSGRVQAEETAQLRLELRLQAEAFQRQLEKQAEESRRQIEKQAEEIRYLKERLDKRDATSRNEATAVSSSSSSISSISVTPGTPGFSYATSSGMTSWRPVASEPKNIPQNNPNAIDESNSLPFAMSTSVRE